MDTAAILRSQLPDVEVGGAAVHEFVLERAARMGDKPALVDAASGRALSYRQLATGVERVAAGLAARGFRPGEVLALYSPNLPEFAWPPTARWRPAGWSPPPTRCSPPTS
jgi:acyl-CoA synthetase (AMP-forming)/AMP-acid ligase II